VVYGGGGIIPDVFIPQDSDNERNNIKLLLHGGYMSRFIFNVLEENRTFYNNVKREEFDEKVTISNEMVQDFVRFVGNGNIRLNVNNHTTLLKQYLKAVIAQQLYGTTAFEKLINENDPAIEKILELSQKN
jgi:carboxyl-terminal processing protease